jgi:Cu(I)/Ag(I) efflux system membrane protein CusA/SilA
MTETSPNGAAPSGIVASILRFCIDNKLVVFLVFLFVVFWGVRNAPFDWQTDVLPRDPVSVDAIPDLGENQQIVFTEWPGRSPRDVDDQITYPLTAVLLGVPGVKSVRSYSMFGFSSIYVIFDEKVDFYWSRSRLLEKLNSLGPDVLPEGVRPMLGPDATAMGQVFWYTLEGRDEQGRPSGGWNPDELRSIQDWQVRYALLGVEGISEVASIGGFQKEYQIDVDPFALQAYGVSLEDVFRAVRNSNIDVGARTIEINRVEYVIRGLGFVRSLSDIESIVVKVQENVPITVRELGTVSQGPALRRGALDKGGAEAVGGIVVVRYGFNPLQAIQNVKKRIAEIAPGLPSKTLPDGTVSKVTIVPYYDRTGLIHETLGTLESALSQEILVTVLVVVVMLMHLRSSLLISALLPLAVLMCFIAMKWFGVDANIVALSGIAIAIGTMVDTGIVVCENIVRHLNEASEGEDKRQVVWRAAAEVGGAVLTAVATTVAGFLPVFAMTGSEGKLFKPLAYTKTFALIASIVVALAIIPPAAHTLFTLRLPARKKRRVFLEGILGIAAVAAGFWVNVLLGVFLAAAGLLLWILGFGERSRRWRPFVGNVSAVIGIGLLLTKNWMPLGVGRPFAANLLFAGLVIGGLLLFFGLFQRGYPFLLGWCLSHKKIFLIVPIVLLGFGGWIWSNLGREFMPPLDEGTFLYMPTTMPHASIGQALELMQQQDLAIQSIPEVETVVGKLGRADSPLDPAPISMFETVIQYKSEYRTDSKGRPLKFRYDRRTGQFVRDAQGQLIEDPRGLPYRQWRSHIHSPDDIWKEIVQAAQIPGMTSAPKLQPIAARIVMLQSGMRAPMGIKIKGPDLETIEQVGFELEHLLKEIPGVEPSAVIADRIVGKPYLEIEVDRQSIARYGLTVRAVQDVIEGAVGGEPLTMTVEGRERYAVRVRYLREFRDQVEALEKILIPTPDGQQIPLIQLASIRYVRGPQEIKREDTFLVGYVLFDKKEGFSEVDVVETCRRYLEEQIQAGRFQVPAGVSYTFAGTYENQVRARKTLAFVIPLALLVIFLILYLQFRSVLLTFLVFSGILVAWSGGFLMIWLYGQPWFLDGSLFGVNLRDLFQIHPVNLSVAIWVGFLALFGIASDDGVVICTYLQQTFQKNRPKTLEEIRRSVLEAGKRRVRPCLMTTATTILALIPVLTSTGRGSDIMIPMAIPSFGGMVIEILTMLIVPVLFCAVQELRLRRQNILLSADHSG